MKTTDFSKNISSSHLSETLEKQFGARVDLNKYNREQLEDLRNKFRTKLSQHEAVANFNDLLTNETYQKDRAILQLLNTRIKEMLGEDIKKLRDKMDELSEAKKGTRPPKTKIAAKGSKPDFLDMDKDGDKKEPMKKAVADKKVKEGFPTVDSAKKAAAGTAGMKTGEKKKTSSGGEVTKTATGAVHKAGAKGYGNKWDGKTQDEPAKPSKAAKSSAEKKAAKANDIKLPAWKGAVTKHSSNHGADKDDGTGDINESGMGGNLASQLYRVFKTGRDQAYHENESITDYLADEVSDFFNEVAACGNPAIQKAYKTMMRGADKDPANQAELATAAMKMLSAANDMNETRTEVKDKEGKVTSWKDEGEWKKTGAKKDPRGKVTHLSDKARRETEKMKENFKHNVRFVNESINYLLQEDEEGKAKAITAAGDMVNDFTSWMQRVGQYQTKTMIELADAIKADFGAAESEAFKQAVGPALSATLEVLTQQRETVSNAVAVLAGEAVPEPDMGMEPDMMPSPEMDVSAPDEMNPDMDGDEFGASDAAAGAGSAGRDMRESKFARKLAESHSIMSKLSK